MCCTRAEAYKCPSSPTVATCQSCFKSKLYGLLCRVRLATQKFLECLADAGQPKLTTRSLKDYQLLRCSFVLSVLRLLSLLSPCRGWFRLQVFAENDCTIIPHTSAMLALTGHCTLRCCCCQGIRLLRCHLTCCAYSIPTLCHSLLSLRVSANPHAGEPHSALYYPSLLATSTHILHTRHTPRRDEGRVRFGSAALQLHPRRCRCGSQAELLGVLRSPHLGS
jgi:hypothetical protein